MSRKLTIRQPARRTGLWLVIGLVVLVAVGLLLSKALSAPAAAMPVEISVVQANEKRDAGVFLLDVRTQEEWNEVHVPGAVLIPLDQLPDRLGEVPQDQEVMVICRTGNRSATGRDILRQAGYEQVTSVAGGVRDWQAAGYATVSGP